MNRRKCTFSTIDGGSKYPTINSFTIASLIMACRMDADNCHTRYTALVEVAVRDKNFLILRCLKSSSFRNFLNFFDIPYTCKLKV